LRVARVVPIVLRLVCSRELLRRRGHWSDRLQNVVGLELCLKAIAYLLVLVLRDLGDAYWMNELVVAEFVEPEEHVADIPSHHSRCLTMNQNVSIE